MTASIGSADGCATSDAYYVRRPGAVVIGAGVSGLTSALCLRRRGFRITVLAEKFTPDIASVAAGALWEWPPAVCGHHHDERSLERSKSWCLTSYDIFAQLACRDDTGVFMREAIFFFAHPVEEVPQDLQKMNELRRRVRGFVHDAGLIQAHGVSPGGGVTDAYSHLAPMIDTDMYMDWLMDQVYAAGCDVVCRRLRGRLSNLERDLLAQYQADVIVNCTGLGSAELTGDDMLPLRAALIRIRNDGHSMPRITKAMCVAHGASAGDQAMVFVVPRGHDMLVLGGLVEADEWDLDISLRSHAPVREMLRRCQELLPVLKDAEIDFDEPVRVGLHPFRTKNVRVERETGTKIIHNYGHGGSSVTFSWGCAGNVVSLAEAALGKDRIVAVRPVVSLGQRRRFLNMNRPQLQSLPRH